MSYFMVPDWFVDGSMKALTDAQIRVILFLIRRANKDGASFWSQHKIAEVLGLQRNAVFNALKQLEKMGFITGQRAVGRVTVYYLHQRFCDDTGKKTCIPQDTGVYP